MSNRDRKVRVGVVGCGVVATAYYLPHLMQMKNAELVAVCDLHRERTDACQRLFGAKETYADYYDMLKKADIEAVFILTAPGTHASFAVAAAEAGKHILVQKPMATSLKDANAIVAAVRKAGVAGLMEPSGFSPADGRYDEAKRLIDAGVLGDPYWFAYIGRGPDKPHPSLAGNPYGVGAFYAKDSGGMLFDYAYHPTAIAHVLGSCKSVQGLAKISIPDRAVVPDEEYNAYLRGCADPLDCNYWRVVLDKEKTQRVRMEAPDNVYSLYEMDNGWIGAFHIGRLCMPAKPGLTFSGLELYGTEGNAIFGAGSRASFNSTRKDLLPETDEDGWYHIPNEKTSGPSQWPIPPKDGFNYYHHSTDHLIDCILEGKDPLVNVEWGRHVTEMMHGALQSSESGIRYEMTTTTTGVR